MSICSKHQKYQPDCRLCNTTINDILPGWNAKLCEAKAKGEHTCENCTFVYYKTTDICPCCSTPRNLKGYLRIAWAQFKARIRR